MPNAAPPPADWFFDRFSIVHAAWGAVAELSNIPAPIAIGAQVAFELVENDIKRALSNLWPDARPDAWQNSVGDVATFIAGYYGARTLKDREGGATALAVLVAAAGAIWTYNLAPRTRNRL
jgi:hypothetical protein